MTTILARRWTVFTLTSVVLCGLFFIARSPAAPNRPAMPASYRVETTVILDRDDAKLVKTRVESSMAFYATVDHGKGRTSAASNVDPASTSHFVEIVVLLDHITSRQCVKELLTVGAAGGPSVQSVTRDYKLNDDIKTNVTDGTYQRDQTIDLLEWRDRVYTLTIAP